MILRNQKAAENLLDSANITCNKNTIPNDPKSPFVTSGVRLGTPVVTLRGMNAEDMDVVAETIAMMIKEGGGNCQSRFVFIRVHKIAFRKL